MSSVPPMADRQTLWSPSLQQKKLVHCPVQDCFYGGARGGGKTDGLLGDILIKANQYGRAFRALFLRRTLKELEDVQRRAQELYPKVGWEWSESKGLWTAPNGAMVWLRYLDEDADAEKYQGWNLTYVAVDEVGNFPSQSPINKLWGALRSAEGVPVFMRLTGNPGGPGHAWVKKRYIDHGPYNRRRWQPQPDVAPDLWVESVFIPSKIEDNPFLMANDPGYKTRLAMVGDSVLYRAWVEGDWDLLSGAYFTNFDKRKHVMEVPPMPEYWVRWAAMDWGYKHNSVVLWGCWDGHRRWVYRELVISGLTPRQLAEAIADCNGKDRLERFYLSPDAFAKRESERSIAMEIGDVFAERNIAAGDQFLPYPAAAVNERVSGWQLIAQGFADDSLLVGKGCPGLVEAIPLAQRDPKKPEDVMKTDTDADDQIDCFRYLVASRARDPFEPKEFARMKALDGITDPNHLAMKVRLLDAEENVGLDGVMMFRGSRRGPRY